MSGLIWSSLSNVRLTGVEPGDRDEPEVVMKRQATGKNSKIPNIFQFHLPSSFLHSTPLKHGTLYIKIMMQLYQKAHTLYMNYQSIHFFQLCVCLFVYISILIEGQKVIVVFFFFIVMGNDGLSFQLGLWRCRMLGGGGGYYHFLFYLFHNSCLGFPSQ